GRYMLGALQPTKGNSMNLSNRTGMLFALVGAMVASPLVHGQDGVRIANEGGIRDQWMLADGITLAAPGYPAAFAARGDNVCVAVGYRIKPDGTTSDYTLLRSWSSSAGEKEPVAGFWDAFSRASASALMEWKFKPRPEVGTPRPVDTVATMTFMGKAAEDAAGLRARCKVEDLRATLQQAREQYGKRDMNRHTLEDNYRRSLQNEARANQARQAPRPDHR
ncbi:MAG: energy transducer TonB, partial [Pseudomonadota bacterium]|nr:energy transducer TonB [Pseudomonadota bacterium]